MKEKASVPSIISMVFGLIAYPLSFFSFFCYLFIRLGRIPDINKVFLVLFYAAISITFSMAIAGIVFGIIGIVQKSKNKRKAIIGIVLSSVLLVATAGFYCFLFQKLSNLNFIFYIL